VEQYISLRGARQNNLKNINLDLPRNKFIVITGVSGSGKSSWLLIRYLQKARGDLFRLFPLCQTVLEKIDKPEIDSFQAYLLLSQ
jgi:excinuclease ABC subunit A